MTDARIDGDEERGEAMEHIQHLTMTGPRNPAARAEPQKAARKPELPDRDRVRKMAELHHKQLLHAKQRTGSHYEMLRAQTDALRKFTLELPAEQADVFMNMYTEESSAVEREWLSRTSGTSVREPLSPMVVTTLAFLVMFGGIVAAIYYVMAKHGNRLLVDGFF